MEIKKLSLGMMGTNCYIVWDEDDNAVIIDPGFIDSRLKTIIEGKSLKVHYILLTHGHFDHIGAVENLKKETGAKVLIHEEDRDCLIDPNRNLSILAGFDLSVEEADGYLVDGQILQVGNLEFKVLHTPGHSKGGICLFMGEHLFSGDTLFNTSIGRTDFHDGDFKELITAIREKLLILPDVTLVYPGHGENTTIGYEKRHNPYLQGIS